MRLRTRMMLAFMIVCIFMITFVGASIWRTGVLKDVATRIATVNSPFAVESVRLHALVEASQVETLSAALALTSIKLAGSRVQPSRQWLGLWGLIRESQSRLEPLAQAWSAKLGRIDWEASNGRLDRLWQAQSGYMAAMGSLPSSRVAAEELASALDDLRRFLGSFARPYETNGLYADVTLALQSDRQAVGSSVKFLGVVLWALLIAGVMISSVVVRSISKSITDPVEEISEAIGRLALGEHNVTIPRTGGILEFAELADAVQVFKSNTEEMIKVTEGIAGGDYRQNVAVRGDKDTLAISINRMVGTLREIVNQAVQISEGDYSVVVKPKSHHDELGVALFDMTRSLQEVAEAVELIAVGNFSGQVRIKGDNDALAVGVNSLIDNFHMVSRQANRIAGGDYSRTVEPLSDRDEIGRALSRMTDSLRHKEQDNQRHSWLKTAQTEILEKLSGDHSLEDLCSRAVGYIAWYLEAQVGVVYVSQRKGRLTLVGQYACADTDDIPDEIEFGSGLVGQCALGRETITVRGVEEDYLHVSTALGQGKPQHVIVVPILLRGCVKGVMEFGSTSEFTREHKQLVEAVAKSLAISITSAENREETRVLLARSQELSGELRAQQDELQQKNVELSSQTKALVRSEVRLRRKTNELQDANDELDRKKTDLEVQSEELEQSSRYKSEFLANVSHELRTPLNSLLILAEMLGQDRDGNLSTQQLESIKVIHDGGKELLNLINDILDLSKVEAGKLDLSIGRVSISDCVEGLRRQFQHMADEAGILLKIEIDPDSPSCIWSDGHRLEQVMKNLLSNAIKFTNEGEVELLVCRVRSDDPRNPRAFGVASLVAERIAFTVVDTGIGVREGQHEAIFESFQQADGSTCRSYGGTGLGLTISRQLAGLLNGEVILERSDSSGSVFTLFLPEGEPVEGEHDQTASNQTASNRSAQAVAIAAASQPEARVYAGLKGRKILLADDDLRTAFALSKVLRDQGLEVTLADNGEHALERLHDEGQFDLVLMDIMMPVMDGLSVIESMRNEPALVGVPVIALTAKAIAAEKERCMEAGASAFLSKPLDVQELLAEIEKWITNAVS